MNVIIVHGTSPHANADKFWYRPLAESLEAVGIQCDVPELPELDREPLKSTLAQIQGLGLQMGPETVLIGHSAGSNIVVALLEQARTPVLSAYLVAGYCSDNGMRHSALKDSYDWDVIRSNAKDFIMLNSFNDPFHCDEKQGKALFDHLGGTLILRNDGHFTKKRQPLLSTLLSRQLTSLSAF
ncbi:RBBP9/YdeN family alpha/beta hydrolase [Bifidobacterium psychraerophilum]|jgi:predicted alpha/beta hydrolase family esterase|uniref:RBBP9/YdeN family alpha/beta hydrolase n=1 Tax=Bifidobacterium psychraerophilum TaxID=218140 RepID=UPI0023F06233|nr:alpha/beta hydrolase [Bifidobacterium psychraerophilum]MCI1659723.1 alpha/beta hydrolase [Bifidobacterium psychraerophilum]MCI1804720.1 alpha/beta hydrolase [Bifidobacterium psychraerophilum]MCI2176854.1 alpha/beta hydrolase [Bifidobacterium psychraerophilum]MCI2182189.1 alpha/beta hydrolase [Bifidobacterium psychraerophilum]